MGARKKVKARDNPVIDEMVEEDDSSRKTAKSGKVAKAHKEQLQRLQEKDPEFFKYLQENDEELLRFEDDEDNEGDADVDAEDDDDDDDDEEEEEEDDIDDEDVYNLDMEGEGVQEEEEEEGVEDDIDEKEEKQSKTAITSEMVDSWCKSIGDDGRLSAVRSLMRAFRTACHYGDDAGDDSSAKFSTMSSGVFNKIMVFVLNEMDGILRKLLKLPASGGKKETISELMSTKQWKTHNHLVKSYLGNALHVLNQMTDTEMISFTLRRLKYSSVFLAAFPSLLRKYIKVALHFWGTGGGALPIVSLLFLRDLCIRLGADCLDECFKGIYKTYVMNCHFVNAVKLQHIQFLGNCVTELLRVDLPTAYQHAFVFIRQLAMLLRDALNVKTKESFRKVYEWKFMNCLELWTGVICAYGSEPDLKPLAYPLTQIISGVSRLVPTARYFPLRLRCVRMLNHISASTGTFIPVSNLLLDMLEMKELNRPPTGGVGNAVDLRTIIKVSKPTLKTRAFQEACVVSVIEELAEHLSQWSYSVAFMELSFIPAVRLRTFCKTTKVDRFRKEMRQLIRQIERNSEFVNERRMSITFLPNDSAATSFLEDEKKAGVSPLSKYVAALRQRAQQKRDSLTESSVVVGEKSSIFESKMGGKIPDSDEEDDTRDEEAAAVFNNSSWLPGGDSKPESPKEESKKKKKSKKKRKTEEKKDVADDEDIVEDLVLSSDEEGSLGASSSDEDEIEEPEADARPQRKNQNRPNPSKKKKKVNYHARNSQKRKRKN